jgi:hypothetical protein
VGWVSDGFVAAGCVSEGSVCSGIGRSTLPEWRYSRKEAVSGLLKNPLTCPPRPPPANRSAAAKAIIHIPNRKLLRSRSIHIPPSVCKVEDKVKLEFIGRQGRQPMRYEPW